MARVPRWFGSMAIQTLGALCSFGIGMGIALGYGPEVQGHYGLVRTAADLLLALALYGLPQSLVHAMNHEGAQPAWLARLCNRYAALLLLLALAVCGALAIDRDRLPQGFGGPWLLLALLVGAIGWTLQGLQRVFVLCRGGPWQFAWLSITPAWTLAIGVAVVLAAGSRQFEWAVLGSGLASVALGAWQLRGLRRQAFWQRGTALPARRLLGTGAHAFAQAASVAFQPWLTLSLMRQAGADVADLGHFVFASYVYQTFALPAAFLAPQLFARISAASGAGRRYAAFRHLRRGLWAVSVACGLCALLLPIGLTRVFGPDYAPTVVACVLLALCGPLVMLNRLGVSVLLGRGRFGTASAHALLRALLLPLALWLAWWGPWPVGGYSLVTGAALAWLVVEAACAAALVVVWKGRAWPGDMPQPGANKGSA